LPDEPGGYHRYRALFGPARDALAARMQTALLGAEFGNKPLSAKTARSLIAAERALLAQAVALGH
jgi:hypothetical protein